MREIKIIADIEEILNKFHKDSPTEALTKIKEVKDVNFNAIMDYGCDYSDSSTDNNRSAVQR